MLPHVTQTQRPITKRQCDVEKGRYLDNMPDFYINAIIKVDQI